MTLTSIEERGLEASVRGPVAAGDAETIALHLRAMEPGDRRLYSVFGEELLRLVGSRLSDESRHELYEQFEKNR